MSHSPNCTVAIIDLSAATAINKKVPQSEHIHWHLRGMTLLEWLSRRLSETMLLDQIIITGGAEHLNKVQSCSLGGTCWMPSPHRDPARRAYDIAQRTDAHWLLFANINAPLIDPSLADRMISQGWKNPTADYIGYVGKDREDVGAQAYGLVGQMCSVHAIEQLVDKQINNCEDVPSGMRFQLPSLQMRLLPLPDVLTKSNKRFAVNSYSDIDRVEMYLESDQDDLSWQRLLQLAEVSC